MIYRKSKSHLFFLILMPTHFPKTLFSPVVLFIFCFFIASCSSIDKDALRKEVIKDSKVSVKSLEFDRIDWELDGLNIKIKDIFFIVSLEVKNDSRFDVDLQDAKVNIFADGEKKATIENNLGLQVKSGQTRTRSLSVGFDPKLIFTDLDSLKEVGFKGHVKSKIGVLEKLSFPHTFYYEKTIPVDMKEVTKKIKEQAKESILGNIKNIF